MDAVSFAASIAALVQLSYKVINYLRDVHDAPEECLMCEIEISNFTSLFNRLKLHIRRGNGSTEWFAEAFRLAEPDGAMDQFKAILEQLISKLPTGGKRDKLKYALLWKWKSEDIDKILQRMERLKALINVALDMDHFKLSEAIKQRSDETHAATLSVQKDTIYIRTGHALEKHQKLLHWISPLNFRDQQSDILRLRQEGTGQWFLDAAEFNQWLNQPKATLFCEGDPGTGKTILAGIAVDHLLKIVPADSVVTYVYCNYKTKQDQNTEVLLAVILKQLVYQFRAQTSSSTTLDRLHKLHDDHGSLAVDDSFRNLQELVTEFSAVHIIVDAADECEEDTRHQMLSMLRKLQGIADVRLMVTSRVIPGIQAEFKDALKLPIRASVADVERYVAGQLHRLPNCITKDTELGQLLQTKIAEVVDGMFLLARLHIEALRDKRNRKQVKLALDNFAKGSTALDQAYDEAIQRINSQNGGSTEDAKLAKRVLSWLTCARRPLTTDEICFAFAVEPGDTGLDPDNIFDIEDLLSVCAGLVVIDKESSIVRLVHYTTQEYFNRIIQAWNPDAELDMASTCLTYLSFDTFASGPCTEQDDLTQRCFDNKFLDYAAKNWPYHIASFQEELWEQFRDCLLQDALFASVEQARIGFYAFGYIYAYGNPTPLLVTAEVGLLALSQRVLAWAGEKAVLEITKRINGGGLTPLNVACREGHLDIVKLFLQGREKALGIEVMKRALFVAALHGYAAVVELFINLDANCNAPQVKKALVLEDGSFLPDIYTPLSAASSAGHEKVVQLLIDHGAEVNPKGSTRVMNTRSPLYAACKEGHENIAKILIQHGADVDSKNGWEERTPLYAASGNAHVQTMKLLIDNGADVHAKSRSGQNPLHVSWDEEAIQLLLNHGVDVNTTDNYGLTPLIYLMKRNWMTTSSTMSTKLTKEQILKAAELLIRNNADVNCQDNSGKTALHHTSNIELGHLYTEIIELLIKKGAADVTVRDQKGRTALHHTIACAISECRKGCFYACDCSGKILECIKCLIEGSSDVNAQDRDGRTALHLLTNEYSHADCPLDNVRYLLEYGACTNLVDRDGYTALDSALKHNKPTYRVVQLLLKHGAKTGAAIQAEAAYSQKRGPPCEPVLRYELSTTLFF